MGMPLFYAPPFLHSSSIAGIKNNTRLSVVIIKAKCNSQYSITEVEMLLRVSALERINIRELLTKPIEKLLNQNPNVKELNLFEF